MARKKITISIAEEWEKRLRDYAVERGLSASTIFQLALEEYLKEREGLEVAKK